MYSNKTVKISQIVLYPFMHLFFKIFFKTDLKIDSELKEKERYIFTPNHPWRMDPFLIFYLMPFKRLVKIMPIRFMTAKKYMINPIGRFFLGLLGCYEINEEVLNNSINLLEKDNNLCIFIQGKISKNYNEKPKIGVVYIERKSINTYITPIKISIDKPLNIINFLLRNVKIKVKFMKKFRHKKFTKDLQPLADKLLNKIKNG